MPSRSAAPDQIVLQLVALAVGVDDLPHHLDDAGASGFVERAVELMGEMIQIDRFVFGGGRLLYQLLGRGIVEIEMLLDDGVQLFILARQHLTVDGCGMDQHRRRREPVIVFAELALMLVAFDEFGNEILERLEHAILPGSRPMGRGLNLTFISRRKG